MDLIQSLRVSDHFLILWSKVLSLSLWMRYKLECFHILQDNLNARRGEDEELHKLKKLFERFNQCLLIVLALAVVTMIVTTIGLLVMIVRGDLIYEGQHGGGGEAIILPFLKRSAVDSGMLDTPSGH